VKPHSLAKAATSNYRKGHKEIEKSLNDFLNSIKTGARSILSPENQLKYAQDRFNGDVTAAQGGDEAAIGRITQDAQNLLDIAKAFYASTTGYTTIYQSVTDAITGLASRDNIRADSLAPNTYLSPSVVTDGMKGFAAGGIVGNGTYGVMVRYAGGGNIGLAGGEAITRAASTLLRWALYRSSIVPERYPATTIAKSSACSPKVSTDRLRQSWSR
jgi:hypothetical protein